MDISLCSQSANNNNSTHSLHNRNGQLIHSTHSTISDCKEPISVTAWGTSFEKLLEDPAGLHTFAIFLKKEFSAENIYFWTACERYRQIDSAAERTKEANVIFSRHLSSNASEPVNVDSRARTLAQDNLMHADRDLFVTVSSLLLFSSNNKFQNK